VESRKLPTATIPDYQPVILLFADIFSAAGDIA
jgi:hypothetical protein